MSKPLEEGFEAATLMITGGTGSFGNAVLRRFLGTGIREIRIYSRDEKKQDDMRRLYRDARIQYYLGDVRNLDSLEEAMTGVDFVFHAAALKQVPSCEFHPVEAIRTNALGTDNVLNAAERRGVRRVVVLSTDKAAYPINAMGMTKALSEKIMAARSRSALAKGLTVCGTRYGNVMASRGSVIPLFLEQIAEGRPLTITNPEMTRFMMTLDSAVDLVLYAFRHGGGGDLFVQKAPAATVRVLAEAILKLLRAENPIRVIGTRHGEKLYETLLTREEMARSEDLGEYFRVTPDNRDLNYDVFVSQGGHAVERLDSYHSHNTRRLDVAGMMKLLLELGEVREAMAKRGVPVDQGD